jgi:hypothetical protein
VSSPDALIFIKRIWRQVLAKETPVNLPYSPNGLIFIKCALVLIRRILFMRLMKKMRGKKSTLSTMLGNFKGTMKK